MTLLAFAFHLSSWPYLFAGLVLSGLVAAIAVRRRPHLPSASQFLIAASLLLLSLAAAGWIIQRPNPLAVTVMIDLSPSTRTAAYRDRAFLDQRIHQLLGSAPHSMLYFSRELHQAPPDGNPLPDLPADQTLFSPPPAAAILLLSDCQFSLPPAVPPTYIAADAMLEDAPDASVQRLEIRGESIAATLSNSTGAQHPLTLADSKQSIGTGTSIVTRPLPSQSTLTARLESPDPWPENNQLSIQAPPPSLSQLWWVGASPPPAFKSVPPSNLPLEPADYLAPSVIVLNNLPTSSLSEVQQSLLQQYVRDLGGSLLILGSDHAFAAGEYLGTPLEALSPLASSPPKPTMHWILLADSSGSMSTLEPGGTRFDLARQALINLLPKLPPQDLVSLGSFAERLTWQFQSKPAKETGTGTVSISPNGPTNLEPALDQIISTADSALEKNLLVLSDADTTIDHPDELLHGLQQKKIHLSLLVIGQGGKALPILRQLSSATNGQILVELSPERWTQAAQKLLSLASPDRIQHQPTSVQFQNDLELPDRQINLFNRTWLKPTAQLLAQSQTSEGQIPLAARWQSGAGQVLSAAFPPTAPEALAMAHLIQHPPHDPRFQITWDSSAQLQITIDAQSTGRYLNNEPFTLTLNNHSHPIPQTAPGRYQLTLPAPHEPTIATLLHAAQVIDHRAIPGRYSDEFNAIGNNRQKMQELATQSGGAVISPSETRPINFHWLTKQSPLTPLLATLGAGLLASGLFLWRRQ